MQYIKVIWHHTKTEDDHDNPIVLYSELDDNRWETRKIEEYIDGRLDYADKMNATGDTQLGIEPVPPLDEINKNSSFEGVDITQNEFEEVWTRAIEKN